MKKLKTLSQLALVAILSLSMVVAGCSFSSAMADLQKYLPVAMQAAEEVLAILVQAGVITAASSSQVSADFTTGNAALGDAIAAVNAYQATPAASQPAALPKVIQALQSAEAGFTAVVTDLKLNPNSNAVLASELALQSIVTTLAAIEANLPTPAPAPAAKAKVAKANVPIPNVTTFKKNFNSIMVSHGYADHQLK